MPSYQSSPLWNIGVQTIKELETDEGILASGREEIFGCIFGRDSLITSLTLLRVYENTQEAYLLHLVRKILINLSKLQGREENIESGEEPGKIIHEFRPTGHERLTKDLPKPWYTYPDNTMRNFDSVDSTALFLIACHEYFKLSNDMKFLVEMEESLRAALSWILIFGDKNGDGFIDYSPHPQRKHGGLIVQSWMDSEESLFHENGANISFPIAPVEVQAYAYAALKRWSALFAHSDSEYAAELGAMAAALKERFNVTYIKDGIAFSIASAIDGRSKAITAIRSSIGHCLWASIDTDDGPDSILESRHIPRVVERLLQPDLFVPDAGIRTLSTQSVNFKPNSYHNGSIWPHDTSIVAEGMSRFGYGAEAQRVRHALLSAFNHFKTPIELFIYDTTYGEYCSPLGGACKKQAWSAASLLKDLVLSDYQPVAVKTEA